MLSLPRTPGVVLGLAVWLGLAGWLTIGSADEPAASSGDKAEQLAFFEAKIRPVLIRHCYDCHSEADGVAEGGLTLDTRAGLLAGGRRGPAIVPGEPDKSLLVAALNHAEADLAMPPKSPNLPAAVIADVRRWIGDGAIDPRDAGQPPLVLDAEAARQHWAYQPPRKADPPEVTDAAWPRQPLDQFILAALEQADLAPRPDAEPATLLRRVHFDLVGLPPTLEDRGRFLQAVEQRGLDEALADEVDRLLETPQFGERWGRHWLDVARFAESSGKEANVGFPDAWRYRDYVLDAFQADIPFDRFLTEQLAGDLLPAEDPHERTRLLVATGFLALGPKNLDEMSEVQFRADLIDEQIDTVSQAFSASTIACARCHDHKFDPFSMQDYYALAGVFASTQTYFGTYVSPTNRLGGKPLKLPRAAKPTIFHRGIPAERVAALKAERQELADRMAAGVAALFMALAYGRDPEDEFTLSEALRIFWRMGAIDGQLNRVDDRGRPLPLALGVLDAEQVIDAPLLERGEIDRPGSPVPRRVPEALQGDEPPTMPADASGRLELAAWLADPAHPLTARVWVNRVWSKVYGAGLVRTVDNFGTTGEAPSHPELLDFLAVELVEDGWSTKRLLRRLLLSRTYRQSSQFDRAAFEVDPDNRLLWRASKRRLDAEAIRDAMLAVAGTLQTERPSGSLVATTIGERPISLIGLNPRVPKDLDDGPHRSVYLPVIRDRLPDVLDLFDFAEPSLVTGQREATNVPLQALYLMNSPFVTAQAQALAQRLTQEQPDDTPEALIERAFLLCFGRLPDDDERRLAILFLTPEEADAAAGQDLQASADERWQALCQALLMTAEFRNLD